jgi:mRNA interferase RelE/StbE
MYKVEVKKGVLKILEKIPNPFYSNVKSALYSLVNNPRPNGYKKLKGINAYRIKVGDYRIIYEIKDKILTIIIIEIGHRKDVYEKY